MSFYRAMRATAFAAGLSVAMAAGALAATVTTSSLSVLDLNGMTPQLNPTATNASAQVLQNVAGNQFSGSTMIARTPWEGSIHQGTGAFSSIGAGGEAIFEFGRLQRSLSLIWGSPDSYNDLVLELMSGNQIVASYTGTAAQPPVAEGASLFRVTDVQFDRLRFTSTSNAFEFANLTTTPIPLPASGLLMIGGMGVLAALRRRKKAA